MLPIPAIVHGCVEVTSRSQVCSDPILILHFVLETLSPSGSPAHLMPLMLEPYRPKINIRFHEIIFDLGTPEKIDNHIKFMEDLVGRLKPTEYERVEIFIYTHSETTRGDIWGGYEDGKASGRRSRTQNRGAPVAYTVNDVN